MGPVILMGLLLAGPAADPRVEYVVSQLVSQGFSRQEAETLFRDPRLKAYPPREVAPRKIDWDQIIAGLLRPASVQQGHDFVAQHSALLAEAEQKFGVRKEVLTALLRMESNLGKNTGNYVALNVFYTRLIQSDEERRWKWAGDNLVALAVFCRANRTDCFEVRGSYGGALGPAQFLPRSLELYGYDGDGDQFINPFETRDAIFSAANFLVAHGWREDQAVALGKYYGSADGYPRAVLAYAEALKQ